MSTIFQDYKRKVIVHDFLFLGFQACFMKTTWNHPCIFFPMLMHIMEFKTEKKRFTNFSTNLFRFPCSISFKYGCRLLQNLFAIMESALKLLSMLTSSYLQPMKCQLMLLNTIQRGCTSQFLGFLARTKKPNCKMHTFNAKQSSCDVLGRDR